MTAIKAVVFDWAGTMIDHGSRAPVIALLELFAAAGVPISEAEARADMGRAKRDHLRALLAAPRVAAAWTAAHGTPPHPSDVTRLHDTLETIMPAAAAACVELIPGAAALVTDLRASGVRIGSCTGYTRAMMAGILPRAAAQGYAPDTVVCSDEAPAGRPSPLMLWQCLVNLGVWPAAAVVKIDDAVVGIAEGRAAGSWTVGVAASGNGVGLDAAALATLDRAERGARIAGAGAKLTAAGAAYVVASVADLRPVLARIAARITAGERPA